MKGAAMGAPAGVRATIRPDPITGLSEDERTPRDEALRTLQRDRGAAWNTACDAAEAQGRRPELRPRSATAICSSSSSTAAQLGRKRPATPSVRGPRRQQAGSSR